MEKETNLAHLLEYISEQEVREQLELFMLSVSMLDCKCEIEYQPLSTFRISIKTSNRNNIYLSFHVNSKKKRLNKVLLRTDILKQSHGYGAYYDNGPSSTSSFEYDFITPLKTAYDFLAKF